MQRPDPITLLSKNMLRGMLSHIQHTCIYSKATIDNNDGTKRAVIASQRCAMAREQPCRLKPGHAVGDNIFGRMSCCPPFVGPCFLMRPWSSNIRRTGLGASRHGSLTVAISFARPRAASTCSVLRGLAVRVIQLTLNCQALPRTLGLRLADSPSTSHVSPAVTTCIFPSCLSPLSVNGHWPDVAIIGAICIAPRVLWCHMVDISTQHECQLRARHAEQCSAEQSRAERCGAVRCGAVRCGAVRCNAVQHSAAQRRGKERRRERRGENGIIDRLLRDQPGASRLATKTPRIPVTVERETCPVTTVSHGQRCQLLCTCTQSSPVSAH